MRKPWASKPRKHMQSPWPCRARITTKHTTAGLCDRREVHTVVVHRGILFGEDLKATILLAKKIFFSFPYYLRGS